MPEAATVEEIEQIYLEGWKLGLKAIYRGQQQAQPLSTSKLKSTDETKAASEVVEELRKTRGRPGRGDEASPPPPAVGADRGHPHKFDIAGHSELTSRLADGQRA